VSEPETDPAARAAQVLQHDLNNKATVIQSNLELLEAGELTVPQARQLGRIKTAVAEMLGLSRAYLDKQRGR
jgi:signal transduction histidine kinase